MKKIINQSPFISFLLVIIILVSDVKISRDNDYGTEQKHETYHLQDRGFTNPADLTISHKLGMHTNKNEILGMNLKRSRGAAF
ncbi:MAG: hypothetical protein HKN76_07800 [Saprospiraceae bacterium]|nr:hypothetical protein [Saprospiraceae bacterium]